MVYVEKEQIPTPGLRPLECKTAELPEAYAARSDHSVDDFDFFVMGEGGVGRRAIRSFFDVEAVLGIPRPARAPWQL